MVDFIDMCCIFFVCVCGTGDMTQAEQVAGNHSTMNLCPQPDMLNFLQHNKIILSNRF